MSNYMWYEATASSEDKDKIKELGFCFADDNESDVILFNEQYEYELVRMYVSDGHGIVDVDVDNFYFAKGFPLGEERSGTTLTINAIEPMTTPVKSFKIRMTDKYPGAQWFYFAPDQEDVLLAADTWMYLYEPDGSPAQEIYYRGMEFEALNPIQSEDYEYSRFDGVEFGFRLHGGVGQLRIKFDSVVDNAGGEWSYGKRIRVLVTEPAAPSIPMGGILTSTSDSVIRVPVEQAGGVIEVYVPPVVLPTVTDLEWFKVYAGVPQQINIGPGEELSIYMWGTSNTYAYDSSCVYSVMQWNLGSGVKGGTIDLSIVDYNSEGVLGVRNETQHELAPYSVRVYSCSSSSATVITVYNSSNNPYNAFKYTSDGTDYYYVLDGTQTDWTDDLSSIGYKLPMVGWFKTGGQSATTDESLSYRYWYPLYNASDGDYMTGNQSNTYKPLKAIKADGTEIDVSASYMHCVLYSGVMNIQFKPDISIEAHHLIFVEQ